MGETTVEQRKIVLDFYMKAVDDGQLWLLVSQLLIDLYDCHLITCPNCWAIHNSRNKEYEIEDT